MARADRGGFGGCAVPLVENNGRGVLRAFGPAYAAQTGLTPQLYVCHAAAGSGVERLGTS